MKQYIVIGVAILIILALNFWQTSYLKDTSRYLLSDINDIQNSVNRGDFESIVTGANGLEKTWNNVQYMWDVFGEHDDIEKITEHIKSIKVYAKYKNTEEIVNEYTLLESLINHVVEAEQIDFSNVL